MRFGIISECATEVGTTHHRRYWETIEEVQLAEEMGFDFFGTSEQHFVSPVACVSAPEVFYAALAMRTSRIKLRHMVVLLPFPFNHPVRVAERLATLDIVSNGRAELGTGRANTLVQIEGFECPIEETRDRWEEALEIVMKAFLHDPFSHQGKYFRIPPRSLAPKGVQQPHPPVFMVTQSPESHAIAGKKGIGALSWEMFLGWDYWIEGIREYQREIAHPSQPVGGYVNDSLTAVSLNSCCAETTAEAVRASREHVLQWAGYVIEELYPGLARQSPSYGYMARLNAIKRHARDIDWLRNETASVVIGDPDHFVKWVQRCKELGAHEVVFKLDGYGHENVERAIRLIGKYVIPKFKAPATLARFGEVQGAP